MQSKGLIFIIAYFLFSGCSSYVNEEYADKIMSFANSLENEYGVNFHEKIGDYKFQDFYGNNVKLLTEGKPILLETFASWCAPCISSLPALNQLSEDYPEVRFIILAHDTPNKLEKYAEQINSNIHLIPSENEVNANNFIKLSVGEFQSVFPFPTTFTIDADGIIQNVMMGAPRAGTFGDRTITEEEVYETNMMRLGRELNILVSK